MMEKGVLQGSVHLSSEVWLGAAAAAMQFTSNLHFEVQEVIIFLMTVFLCLGVLNLKALLLNRRAYKDLRQRHSTHLAPTPRLGGAVLVAAILVTTLFFEDYFGGRYAKFALSMLPMIMVTLWEDTVRPTSPTIRLLGVVLSCLFTITALHVWMTRIDLPWLDQVMGGTAGMLISVLFVTGTVNGFNMIDGLNGLCAGTTLAALLALNVISTLVGYEFMAHVTMSLGAAIAGFLLFNFPRGRMFLGDTGAYVLAYVIAWFGISICFRYPSVSPWSIFLILGYPISEVGITFFRRLLAGVSAFRPDKHHLHHLMFALAKHLISEKHRAVWQNPVATLLTLPLAIGPMIFAVAFYNSAGVLQAGAAAYALVMVSIYAGLLAMTKRGTLAAT